MKTSKLTGAALDWAVAKCEGMDDIQLEKNFILGTAGANTDYSTDWAQGGPIIEREEIGLWCNQLTGSWGANKQGIPYEQHGPTPLVAAMCCYVASKLGDDVEIPESLT